MEWATPAEAPRASFVTVVAWIYIGLEGLTAFVLVLQNIFVNMLYEPIREAIARTPGKVTMPPLFAWAFDHLRLILALCLLVALIKLIAAIGLLRRRNWARLLFIGILAFSVAWSFATIALQQLILSSPIMMPVPPNAPENFDEAMEGMMVGMRVVSALFAIGFAVLFGWMIKKLLSPAIMAEFA